MLYSYNYLLVALSLAVAVQAGYVGLLLAQRIPVSFAFKRRQLIAASALTLSVGIWSMHFVGMLAIISKTPIDYLVLPTLLSFLVCVLVTGIGIYLASLRSKQWLIFGALFMGLGIATMHYVGMMALHSSAQMDHNLVYVSASVLIAVAASGLALWLAFLAGNRFPILLDAVIFGLAVSGMHYTAMAGTKLNFISEPNLSSPLISSDVLGMIVSVVAFSISGIFMLALIPKETYPAQKDLQWDELSEGNVSFASGKTFDSTQRGASSPSPVFAEKSTVLLPIEKNGNRFQIAINDVVSVHANAHYTYIFNGKEDLFCALSISDVHQRLLSSEFFRTHRSYIVNLKHVARVRKSGDAAMVDLDSVIRRSVPVSRTRVTLLRTQLSELKAKADVIEA